MQWLKVFSKGAMKITGVLSVIAIILASGSNSIFNTEFWGNFILSIWLPSMGVYLFYRFFKKPMPDKINNPEKTIASWDLTNNFGYPYSCWGTAVAFNPSDGTLFLRDEKGNKKIYGRKDIRSYEWDQEVDRQTRRNLKTVYTKAFDEYGLTFFVSDRKHPEWLIICCDQKSLSVLVETTREFMEGSLPAVAHSSKR